MAKTKRKAEKKPKKQAPIVHPCAAVIVAAGASSRMGGKTRKPYLDLRGKPVLSWALAALARVPGMRQIVLVTREDDRAAAKQAAKLARLPKSVKVDYADGGVRRQDSVNNGLLTTSEEIELVLIHDGARPFPPLEAMKKAVDSAASHGGAILAVPVRDTVKRQSKHISPHPADATHEEVLPVIYETISRAGLWLAQTPQVFRRSRLFEDFERLSRTPELEVTDDASVLERFGHAVALIESSPVNLKITRGEDLALAEAYLKAKLVK